MRRYVVLTILWLVYGALIFAAPSFVPAANRLAELLHPDAPAAATEIRRTADYKPRNRGSVPRHANNAWLVAERPLVKAGHRSGVIYAQALDQALRTCRPHRKQRREGESLGEFLRRPNSRTYYGCVDSILDQALSHDPLARLRWHSTKSQFAL